MDYPFKMKTEISTIFKKLQDQICLGLEKINTSSKFSEDLWERPGGGGGRSRTLSKGKFIQKGGVNFSEVSGPTPETHFKIFRSSAIRFLCYRCFYRHSPGESMGTYHTYECKIF